MRRVLRGTLVAAVIGGVFLTSTGVRVIVLIALPPDLIPRGDEWFPCRDHRCGCLNAEMCRTRCCCARAGRAAQAMYGTVHRADPAHRRAGFEVSAGEGPGDRLPPCCARKARPAAEGRKAPIRLAGLALAVQSRACAGTDESVLSKAGPWLGSSGGVSSPPAVAGRWPIPLHEILADLASLSPDPPPPRAC